MTIGELAEQAGVSTRRLRFWADEGLIPCDRTVTGYRSFGPDALPVAGLIRVLREVDVDLRTIRAILEGRSELAGVVTAHLGAIEARIAQLRFHRSVLRAVASIKEPTTQELQIVYDLANLTAEQRRQIITDLVDETFAGLDDPGPVADRMRTATPDLPDDPSPEQVAAWVEVAQLVQDPAFRARVRQMAVAGAGGVPPDESSATLAEVVERICPVGDRAALADQLERFTDERVDRYWALLGVINGWPGWPSQVPAFEWFIAALRA